jgi:hypothetical protein
MRRRGGMMREQMRRLGLRQVQRQLLGRKRRRRGREMTAMTIKTQTLSSKSRRVLMSVRAQAASRIVPQGLRLHGVRRDQQERQLVSQAVENGIATLLSPLACLQQLASLTPPLYLATTTLSHSNLLLMHPSLLQSTP